MRHRCATFLLSALLGAMAPLCSANGQQAESVQLQTQKLLMERACDVGTLDGVWGPRSQSALDTLAAAAGISGKIEPSAAFIRSLKATDVRCPASTRTANHLICSDYGSKQSCSGGKYFTIEYTRDEGNVPTYEHRGIDFRAEIGTPVFAATSGILNWSGYDSCGGAVVVRSDILAPDPKTGITVRVYAFYVHIDPAITGMVRIRAGDLIGRIQDPKTIKAEGCNRAVPHVHYAMRTTEYPSLRTIDPHQFWIGGRGKATCYVEGITVPADKAVAPLRC